MNELILELVGQNTRWSFNCDKISIGRDPNCDVVLPTEPYPMVSRSHLLLTSE
jgi:pSer/pThr/pTyr-binding forkhead associated (FHA) protein